MTKSSRMCMGGAALLLVGCSSTNPPLMFGDATTVGLRLGNDGATSGGSVSLGYKAQSVAIVPVTYLGQDGRSHYLNGISKDDKRDGLSVFASFESEAPRKDGGSASIVKLGQVFSTGLAAQELTSGYLCREDKSGSDCTVKTAVKNDTDDVESKNDKNGRGLGKGGPSERPKDPPKGEEPYQAPLIFARTDVYGVDIGGSLAQQGLQFVLGYGNRNLALIPTTTRDAFGKTRSIMGKHTEDGEEPSLDVLSVIGQFKANTETTRLGFGLERYFATGVAARNLGSSIRAAIVKGPEGNQEPAKPAATGNTVAEANK